MQQGKNGKEIIFFRRNYVVYCVGAKIIFFNYGRYYSTPVVYCRSASVTNAGVPIIIRLCIFAMRIKKSFNIKIHGLALLWLFLKFITVYVAASSNNLPSFFVRQTITVGCK